METRYYTGAKGVLRVNGQPLVRCDIAQLTLTIDYQTDSCFDDKIDATSTIVTGCVDISSNLSPSLRAIAAAALTDLTNLAPLHVEMKSIQPAGQTGPTSNNRSGAIFDVPTIFLRQ